MPHRVLALVFVVSTAHAATISGTVFDPDGRAAPRATVTVYARDGALRQTVRSDDQGLYRLERLPAGRYLIDASMDGAAEASAAAELREDEARTLDLTLDLARVATRVTVTAAATAQSSQEVARALDIVTANEASARGEFSVTDAIQTVPGLRVQSLGGPGAFTRILSRGLRTHDTAVTIDGLRFRDAATTQGDASPFLENLFLAGTERVEVLRGTGASLYGSNAIGGVVNVVSDAGGGPLHGQVLAEGGGLGVARGQMRLAGGSRTGALGFNLGLQHLNVTRGVDTDQPFRNSTVHAALQWRPVAAASLSGRIWAGDSFAILTDSPYAAPAAQFPPGGPIRARPLPLDQQRRIESGQPFTFGDANFVPNLADPDNQRASRFATAALLWTHQVAPSFGWRASYQRVESRRHFRDGPAGVRFEPAFSTSTRINGGIDTLQLRGDWVASRALTLTGGWEFEREAYANPYSDPTQTYRADASQRSNAAFFATQSRFLGDRLMVALAGRYQAFSLRQPTFTGTGPYTGLRLGALPAARTGDAAVAYLVPSTSTKFRAHAGNGYRAPSIYERVGASFFDGFFSALGDPRLRPERSLAFDWGIDQYLAGQRVRVSATHFYTSLQEVIFFDFSGFISPETDPFGRFGGYRNTGAGLARGVELSVEATPWRGTSITGSYTHTNSDQRTSTVIGGDFFKAPLISDHQFTAVLMQRLTRRLNFVADLWMVSEHPFLLSSRAFLFPGGRKLDTGAQYDYPLSEHGTLRVSGRISNVFNHRYYENGFRTPGIWGVAGLSYLF
ncbi:MAG: TonB-dependent receptor [Bryobacterales bacterium]|nr:TonB-dependent receptor [Bryobacterales bacterium]